MSTYVFGLALGTGVALAAAVAQRSFAPLLVMGIVSAVILVSAGGKHGR